MMKLPSLDLSMESKRKNVDVSLNVSGTPRCDEASSSGYSDLPKRSEGQDVGAPRCDEPPSSSSSSGPTSDPIRSILKDKVEDVNPDDLWKHIFELWKLREKGNHKQPPSLGHFPWPDFPGLQKFKELVSFGTGLPIQDRHGAILEEIGMVNVATAAPLVVALTLESLDARITIREKFWHLIKEMYDLAIVLKGLSESPEGMQDVMQEATSLIMEGALVCSTQIVRSRFSFLVSQCEIALSEMRQKLHTMSTRINIHITCRDFTLIQHQRRSHLSKECPTHAEKVEDVNLDDLWKHIFELWKQIEKGNHKKAPGLGHFPWPDVPGLQKLKEIVSFGTGLRIQDRHGAVKAILEEIGRVNVATAAPLVVAHTLGSLDARITIEKEFSHLIKEMYDLAIVLKGLSESPEGMQDVMQEATSLIIEGALVFSLHGGRRGYLIPESTFEENLNDLNEIRQKLNAMYMHINTEITVRVSTLIQHQRRSHLSKEYPTQAGNGQVEKDLLLTVEEDVPELEDEDIPELEDAYMPELEEAYIHTPQVEEDLPEPQKTYIRFVSLIIMYSVVYNAIFWKSFQWVFSIFKIWPQLKKSNLNLNMQLKNHFNYNKSRFNLNFNCNKSRFNLNFFRPIPSPKSPKKNPIIDNSIHNNNEPVEEDLLVPEPQKAYIHNHEQVDEDVLSTGRQKVFKMEALVAATNNFHEDNKVGEGAKLVPEPPKAYIHNHEQVDEDVLSTGRQKVFKMEALVAATNNFHEDNKVGEGGFGAVYKGTTHDGKQIAVKKMSFTSDERSPEFLKKQFENEKLLAEVQHRNLVNLLGSCEQESQGFLVYEYLPNGSLDKFLFDPENRKLLDWPKRSNIIQGTARGLQYLHEDSRVRIVHRDIKASNILLDEKLNPKIADFGTANLFPEDRTHVTATSPVGTTGYMAPEYFMTRQFTVTTDVYSFGIVVLELVTGKKISSDALTLLGWVWDLYNRKEALQTIDQTIETSDKEAAKALRCIQVGLLCIQQDSCLRPTMSEVIAMLSTYESLPDPKNPPCLPSYRATQENGNSIMGKLRSNRVNAFMRAVFETRNRE